MSRQDFGFVFSRGLAVWVFIMGVTQMTAMWGIWQEPLREYQLTALGTNLFLIGVAILLWTKADAFAGPAASATSHIDSRSFRNALFAAVGLLVLLGGLAEILRDVCLLMLPQISEPLRRASGSDWLNGAVRFLVGTWIFVKYGSFSFGDRAKELWTAGDPEEMTQDEL